MERTTPLCIKGYTATENGEVIGKRGRVLKLAELANGYLFFSQNRGTRDANPTLVHRFVWEYFNGPIPSHLQIDHIDGDKANNRLDNLQLLTPKENTRKSRKCKLTEDDKQLIKEMSGLYLGKDLASMFGVSRSMISMVTKGKR